MPVNGKGWSLPGDDLAQIIWWIDLYSWHWMWGPNICEYLKSIENKSYDRFGDAREQLNSMWPAITKYWTSEAGCISVKGIVSETDRNIKNRKSHVLTFSQGLMQSLYSKSSEK